MPSDLVELLRGYPDGKPAEVPLWPGEWAGKGEGAEMLRADLAEAGIPSIVEVRMRSKRVTQVLIR